MVFERWPSIFSAMLLAAAANATPLNGRACNAPYNKNLLPIPGQYIVVLPDDYSVADHLKTIGITFTTTKLPHGYFAALNPDQLNKVRSDCKVKYVEDNFRFEYDTELQDDLPDPTIQKRTSVPQPGAPWNLVQVGAATQRSGDKDYWYLDDAGKGVTVYVIDSGIDHTGANAAEFTTMGIDRVKDEIRYSYDNSYADDNAGPGHGTPVASIVGGNKHGVAKFVTISNVRARSYNNVEKRPYTDGAKVEQAMRDIIDKHKAAKAADPEYKTFKGSIINISSGGAFSQSLSDLFDEADNEGISLVTAPGNSLYKENVFPASHPKFISVGASTQIYTPWVSGTKKGSGSNYGDKQMSIWAPGAFVPIQSKLGSSSKTASGTSISAPHVAGILAIFYSTQGKDMNPARARELLFKQSSPWIDLRSTSTINPITDWKGSTQTLANTGNRKGAKENPPVKYVGGPNDVGTTSSSVGNPVCAGVATTKWMGRDALNGVIPQFCDAAEKQGVQDKDSGSLQRTYLDNSVDKVSLSIDWPSGGDFKPKKDDCIKYLSTIMDGCDGNDPVHNPLNWKHGGSLQAGIAKFNVNPLQDRYVSGTCSVHVHETEFVDGFNTPGFSQQWYFFLGAVIKDAKGKIVAGTSGNEVQAGQNAANPYILNGLYAPLSMLPESQGGDYIQFHLGDQAWPSSQTDQSKPQHCSVGAWDTSDSTFYFTGGPRGRDMDCWVLC